MTHWYCTPRQQKTTLLEEATEPIPEPDILNSIPLCTRAYSPASRVVFRLVGLGGRVGACLLGALTFFLLGGTSSPLWPAPAVAPLGGTGDFLGLGLGLGLGGAVGGRAGAAGVSGWIAVFSTNEKVNRAD